MRRKQGIFINSMDQWLDHSELFDKAQEYIDLGLFEEAKSLLDHYAHTLTDEWELYFLYSRLYSEQNKPEEAIHYLQTALKLDPSNADCLLGLFYAYAMLHRMTEAGDYLFLAEKYHPDHELIISALIWYYAERNDLEKAIACFERIRDKGPINPETLRNAGIAYDRSGFYDQAVDCYETALELFPQYDEVRELLSDLYLANGKPDLAIALYEKALSDSPRNIRYLSRLVFCLSQNNQAEKAIGIAEESIRQYPNSPIGYIDLAYARLNNGQLDEGLGAAEKAIDIAPLDAETFRVKAILLSEKKMDADAEKTFESSLALDPDNIETLRDYYNHLHATGHFKKMEECALRAIEKGGSACIEDFWFLADFHRSQKEYAKSFHYLHRAYVQRPGEHDLIPMMADVLISRKHIGLALRFIKRYVDRAGWDVTAEQFAGYPELHKKLIGEGLNFLRFIGGSTHDFQRFLFKTTARALLRSSLVIVLCLAAFPVYLVLGKEGLWGLISVSILSLGISIVIRWFRRRIHFQQATP
jgi:tetratricopeptide (TPR) repeat protein